MIDYSLHILKAFQYSKLVEKQHLIHRDLSMIFYHYLLLFFKAINYCKTSNETKRYLLLEDIKSAICPPCVDIMLKGSCGQLRRSFGGFWLSLFSNKSRHCTTCISKLWSMYCRPQMKHTLARGGIIWPGFWGPTHVHDDNKFHIWYFVFCGPVFSFGIS
jgi:hypothetical protein